MRIQSYPEAAAYLEAGRDKSHQPLPGRSTALERRGDGTIAVRYHATDVVTFYQSGSVILNSGGWRTNTTKERMSTYGPTVVSQSKGLWYVPRRTANDERGWDRPILFFDGIEIGRTGKVLNAPADNVQKHLERAKRRVDRLVTAYIKGFCEHLRATGHVEEPSGGDCWYCSMVTEDGRQLGDAVDNDHLLAHFEEGYYVPALLLRAIQERRYGGGVAFIVAATDRDLARGQDDRYQLHHVKDSLRAYFRGRKLALAEILAQREEQAA